MGANRGLCPVFAVGHEHVETLFAILADKVISWHVCILSKTLKRSKTFVLLRYNKRMSHDPEFTILNPQPLLIVISGPSGVGKDTVMQRMQERGMPFHFVVTATTRPKRESEVHGKDYFFVSKDEFARMIEENELIEYSIVYSDYKGIPKQQVR